MPAKDERPVDVSTISREEVIEQVKAAGLASRVIGQEPEKLSDAELADLVDELHRRTVVAEHTGKDVREVGEQEFGDLVRAGNRAAFEDTTGVGYDRLTDLGKLVVDAKLRDTTGTSGTGFDQFLDDAVAGREGTAFVDLVGGSDGDGDPSPPDGQGDGGDDSGGGSDAGLDDGFGSGFDDGTGDDSGAGGSDDVTGGADDPGGSPPDGDGFGEDVDATGGSDPGGEPSQGGSGEQGGGSVGTVFEVSVGSTESDPASEDFGDGPLTTFARGEDGTWYDEAGNEVTDPDSVAALEAQYDSYHEQGGQDTPGEITPSGETHEDAVAGEDDEEQDGEPADSDDDDDPDDGDSGSDAGSGEEADGETGDAAGGGVETTPDEDAPPPPPDDLDLHFEPGPKTGTTDPADDGGINSGPIDTSVELPDKFDLIGQPGSDSDLDFGGGARVVVGVPGGPDPGQVDPVPDDGFGAGAAGQGSGPEIDPFERAGGFEPVERPAPDTTDDEDDDPDGFAQVDLHRELQVRDVDVGLTVRSDLHRDDQDVE